MTDSLPPEWNSWLAEGARLLGVPQLRRAAKTSRGPEDPKFAIGDFLCTVPSQFVDALAAALGVDPSQFRSYRDVADKVPPSRRVAASWGVHRQLKEQPDLLRDGLTIRGAAKLLGIDIDSKADHNLPV